MNRIVFMSAVVIMWGCWAVTLVPIINTGLAQDRIELDLSKMKGAPVAMDPVPITNKLVLYSGTNCWSPPTYSIVLSVEAVVKKLRDQGDMTNLVNNLVKSGDVCAVIGHKWDFIPHVTLEYRSDGCYPEHRKCALCAKSETKEPGVWK